MAVNKCSVTNEDVKNIKQYFENLGYEYDGNLVELQDTVTRKLEELRMYDQRQRPMLVNAIMEVVEDWDSQLGTQFFNITNITNIIQESNQGVQRLNANDYGTDRLEKGETAQTRKEVNRDFLNKAFGTAITAKKALETKVLTNMVRSVIINRDNINKDTGERMVGLLVDNQETMNEQLEAYKEQLLETVLKYLKMVNPDTPIDTMFNNKGYTGILEEIRGDINKYLNPTNFTAEIIASTHSFDPNDLQLQAYYAVITLDNFDTWLSLLFKDAVNINTFNVHSKNNYSFSEKLAKLSHTWKVDDEDHVEEHISSFVQAIINTTPMYKKGNLIPNSYMKFNDFNWEDIIYEAPNEPDESEDGLSATDYSDESNLEVDDVSEEEDLGAEDYTEMENEEEPADDEGNLEENPEDPTNPEAEDGMDEGGLEGEGEENPEDDSLDDEQQDNTENDPQSQQNKYLAHDFIELYNRQKEIIDKIRKDSRLNAFTNQTTAQVKRNLEKLSQVTYDYILDKFSKETYVANLYQFNLIIQAMNLNVQMLEEVNERILKEEEN